MTKKIWLSLLLALILAIGGLSALAEPADSSATEPTQAAEPAAEPAAQQDTAMLTINGEAVMYSEVAALYQSYMQQYQSYGMDFTDESNQQSLMNMVLGTILQDRLIAQKAAELGLDVFTEEEEAALREGAQTKYDQTFAIYLQYLSDETKTDEENQQAVAEQLEGSGYTLDALTEDQRKTDIYNRVYAYATEGVSIPDAAVKTAYDEGLAAAKEKYAQNLAAYATDLSSGAIVYYTPEGYRTVKHILVKFDKAAELKELRGKLAELKEGDEGYADTVSQIDELMKDIQPKLDEITAKIEAGEDFQALIDQYGEDGGMKSGTTAQTGYYLCEGDTTYVAEFSQGGMALEKVGDVSEPVLTAHGFHIIRYNSDVASGETPYEDVKEALKTQLLNEALTEKFNAALSEWAAAADIQFMEQAAQ